MANDTNRKGQRLMLGDRVRDIITQFEGTIINKTEELGGNVTFGIQGTYNTTVGRCPSLLVNDANALEFIGKSDYTRGQEGTKETG